ncbi:hypothetical protein Ahy_B10g104262 isoform B [Arachis hypogaea]|uniref:Uncharacterized protein n=1 Tax=Arachis hypogaea TaxID=3818 RepID=A0A444X532_ARAHY|nr:hypothetical protein Ahy_B10g104262 isoform B [Arachis hypogaea]
MVIIITVVEAFLATHLTSPFLSSITESGRYKSSCIFQFKNQTHTRTTPKTLTSNTTQKREREPKNPKTLRCAAFFGFSLRRHCSSHFCSYYYFPSPLLISPSTKTIKFWDSKLSDTFLHMKVKP